MHLLEIDELTPSSYKEHVVKNNLLPTETPLYHNGGHQLNFAEFKGKIVVATDLRIKILKLLHLKVNTPY